MNEWGIAKGQGEFTQENVADGGQKVSVNNLRGELSVEWHKDNSEWVQFTNLLCQQIGLVFRDRWAHSVRCNLQCSSMFITHAAAVTICLIAAEQAMATNANATSIAVNEIIEPARHWAVRRLSDKHDHHLIAELWQYRFPLTYSTVALSRNKAVCHAVKSIAASILLAGREAAQE